MTKIQETDKIQGTIIKLPLPFITRHLNLPRPCKWRLHWNSGFPLRLPTFLAHTLARRSEPDGGYPLGAGEDEGEGS